MREQANRSNSVQVESGRSPLSRIVRGISTVIVAIAVVLAVALVGVRLIGFDVYTVLSGSMEPTYKTGSVIWVKSCEPEDVEVGDPITFVLNEDLVVATHRVIDIDEEEGCFYTQGDANDAPDGSPVLYENLIGKPVFTVPGLGYLVSYVQSPPGCYVALAVAAVVLMLMFLPDIFAKDEGEEQRKQAKRANARGAGDPGRHAQRAMSPQAASAYQMGKTSQGPVIPRGQAMPQQASAQRRQAQAVNSSHATQVQPRRTAASAAATQTNNPRLRSQSSASTR